jgi:putative DNA primase/helicase
VPLGKVTVLDGDPDEGKSTIAFDLAARVSTGAPMPFETDPRTPAGVVILSAEDGLADTIRPRLDAAGADVRNVLGFPFDELPSFPKGIEVIEQAVIEVGAKLVIIDPLMAFLSDRVDSYRDHHVRRALAPSMHSLIAP